jgi:integrase
MTERTARHMGEHAVIVQRIDTGERHDVTKRDDDAFWCWSIVETLRHTGIRVEELRELTQMAVAQYQLPDTGEVVPLLQIVPAKSGEERVLLVGPELANVRAAIIARLRQRHGGKIPAVSRYDPYERVEGPPLPHLFQRSSNRRGRSTVIGTEEIYKLLELAVTHARITDATGQPMQFRPHDFRRMFATEAVTGGLPVHIAAKVLGHVSLQTTQHYLAVFPDEMIRSYRAYLDKRRSIRPEAEYREPTQEEWAEFRQHFHERKLELGTCGRPYGTPCQHEHACVRCPMLRMAPNSVGASSRSFEILGTASQKHG